MAVKELIELLSDNCDECSNRDHTEKGANQYKLEFQAKAQVCAESIAKIGDATQTDLASSFYENCFKENCPNAQYCLRQLAESLNLEC